MNKKKNSNEKQKYSLIRVFDDGMDDPRRENVDIVAMSTARMTEEKKKSDLQNNKIILATIISKHKNTSKTGDINV